MSEEKAKPEKHVFVSYRIRNLVIGRFKFDNFRCKVEEHEVEELKGLIQACAPHIKVQTHYVGPESVMSPKVAQLAAVARAGTSSQLSAPGVADPAIGANPPPKAAMVSGPVASSQLRSPTSTAAAVAGIKVDTVNQQLPDAGDGTVKPSS